jgi:membrane protein YdbS with pleckstrin-like domain
MNYVAILACGVLSIALGAIWYGPVFGKKYMELFMPKNMTPEQMMEGKKQAKILYAIQFLLALFQVYVLAWFVGYLSNVSSGIHTAFGISVGFVLTTIAGTVLWNAESNKVKWQKFLIQAGYQLIFFLLSGYILSVWK